MDRVKNYLNKLDATNKELLQTATLAALEAGAILQDLYKNPHNIKFKGEIDLVTEADIASEKAIISILSEKTPSISILAEESAANNIDVQAGPVWIIDPLDGTTNFAHGFPYFCVSIALYHHNMTKLGVIYEPMLDELFYGVSGAGSMLNNDLLSVSSTKTLNHSLLATGFPYDVRENSDEVIAALHEMLTKAQGIRRAGAAALDLAYVAAGRFDGFWEIKLKPWDTAAGLLLVQEAGGKVTDFKNRDYSPFCKEILASNSMIHHEMTTILEKYTLTK